MRRPNGFTLIECLVASTMFLLMSASLFMIFRTGAAVWLKSDASAEVLGKLQTLSAKIGREAENSFFDSLALASRTSPTQQAGCSFLSAKDVNGEFQYHPSRLMPDWQRALVFYFDKNSRRVYRLDPALGRPSIMENLSFYNVNYQAVGPPPVLLSKFVGGVPIANGIEKMVFSAPTRSITLSGGRGTKSVEQRQLQIEVTVRKAHYGGTGHATITSKNLFFFRN